ncbi:hypothetical protein, partial [Pseudomonas aeruginosa]|uniref:hypothetical protein n=1 Tax=Pseudomonas aeruginosa TaxID=287 RepID=UPI0024960EDB
GLASEFQLLDLFIIQDEHFEELGLIANSFGQRRVVAQAGELGGRLHEAGSNVTVNSQYLQAISELTVSACLFQHLQATPHFKARLYAAAH